MKANEAPEKLYVDTEDRLSDSILYGFTEKRKDDDIEYVRKDVFIEKACELISGHVEYYMKKYKSCNIPLCPQFATKNFIEFFKTCMED